MLWSLSQEPLARINGLFPNYIFRDADAHLARCDRHDWVVLSGVDPRTFYFQNLGEHFTCVGSREQGFYWIGVDRLEGQEESITTGSRYSMCTQRSEASGRSSEPQSRQRWPSPNEQLSLRPKQLAGGHVLRAFLWGYTVLASIRLDHIPLSPK